MINFFNTIIHFFCSPGLSQQTGRICYKDESQLCKNRYLTRGTLPYLMHRWKGTGKRPFGLGKELLLEETGF